MWSIKSTLLFLPVLLSFKLQAQSVIPANSPHWKSEIGISGGIHKSGFYGEEKNEYAKYKSYWSYMASAYYKASISNKLYAGFELEKIHVKSNFYFLKNITPRASSIYDALLDLDYINFHFLVGDELFSIKGAIVSGTLSPYVGYLLQSKATGYEKQTISYVYSDSLGLHTGYFIKQDDVDEKQARKARQMNAGMGVSLDLTIPLRKELAFVLKTSYNIGVYNTISEKVFTGIRGYAVSVGAVYKLYRKS